MVTVWVVQLATYASLVLFLVMVIAKAIRYSTAPMHVRWELYPVPHERGKGYGGSYMEELDWWTRPRQADLANEIKAMAAEMLLIKALWHNNRTQWYVSFPFHIGLYLLIGFLGLLLVGAVIEAAGFPVAASSPLPLLGLLHYATLVVGLVGLLSATVGAAGLLYRRLTDENLKRYSSPSDYFNLAFLLAVFAGMWVAWATMDSSFVLLREFVRGIVTLNPSQTAGAILVEVLLVCLFVGYLPFTHMTHFLAKYFTWHQVRWDDEPNLPGSSVSRRITRNLIRPIGWSAPHIQVGKNWAEVATEE